VNDKMGRMKERLAAIDGVAPRHVGTAPVIAAVEEPKPLAPKREVASRERGRGVKVGRKLPEQLYESKYRRQTFYVDDALIVALDSYCAKNGLNKSEVVREALATRIGRPAT
jgi:Ribbon-helix-helix protein, copG family